MTDTIWDVLAIGNLSRNKFWGEPDDRALRPVHCTSTLIRSHGLTLVVDPGHGPEQMAELLDRRAGLTVDAVDAVFVTHRHADHRVGIDAFPRARLYMAADELRDWAAATDPLREEAAIARRFTPSPTELTPDVRLLVTNGHTTGHTSLVVEAGSTSVVIAGDAAMSRSFFDARDVYFNTVDRAAARESLDRIALVAAVVVPGHDNQFARHLST